MLPHQRVVHVVVVAQQLDTTSDFLGSTARGAASASLSPWYGSRWPLPNWLGIELAAAAALALGWVEEWPEDYRKKKRAGPGLPKERRQARPYV